MITERRTPQIGRRASPCQVSSPGTKISALLSSNGVRAAWDSIGQEEVGAELVLAAVVQVDQHGEPLHPEIGVRFEPEAVEVLGVFQAHIGPGEVRAGGRFDSATMTASDWNADATAPQAGKRALFSASK